MLKGDLMIYDYDEIIKKYGNWYKLKKAIEKEEIFKIDNGLYSTTKSVKEIDIIVKKYNNPIFTFKSAFYYYGISDVIPDNYYIASSKNGAKYNDPSIKQFFMDNDILYLGVTSFEYLGTKINIYSKERLLIELIRYKHDIAYDYYKEVINYYRKNVNEINFQEVIDILKDFPKKDMILKTIQEEVL